MWCKNYRVKHTQKYFKIKWEEKKKGGGGGGDFKKVVGLVWLEWKYIGSWGGWGLVDRWRLVI